MKTLEKGNERIQKICAVLRDETLEPAKQEAQGIIKEAEKQAENIIAEAHKEAEKVRLAARAAIEQEKNVFEASLFQATKQSVESLKQSVEKRFFNQNLVSVLEKDTADTKLIANLVNAIAKAIEKEGLSTDLEALVSKTVNPREVNELLLADVVKALKGGGVTLGNFTGGTKVILKDKKMTVDISADSLKELLSNYVVRKDFRKMIFES